MWGWFNELVGLHTNGGLALNPLQPTEIEAWARLRGITLRPWEAGLLFRMDTAFIGRLSKPKEKGDRIDASNPDGIKALMATLGGNKNDKPRRANNSKP